jgi:hypothetical protein
MRSVFRSGVLVSLLVVLVVPALYADDPPPQTEPPGVRILPPGGLTAQDTSPETEPQVRIGPPGGLTDEDDSQMRIGPPGGLTVQDPPPTLIDLFRVWLLARMGVPIG